MAARPTTSSPRAPSAASRPWPSSPRPCSPTGASSSPGRDGGTRRRRPSSSAPPSPWPCAPSRSSRPAPTPAAATATCTCCESRGRRRRNCRADPERRRSTPTAALPAQRPAVRADPVHKLAPMGLVWAIANQKGGVGKTTTTVSVGACVAASGSQTLIVDLDPQCNATVALGGDREARPSSYQCLIGDVSVAEAARPAGPDNLWLVPASRELAGASVELPRIEG